MDSDKAHLRLLLNDIHVDLGIFLTGTEDGVENQDNLESFFSVQLSDFKERISNLENSNRKYEVESVKDNIGEFVIKARESINLSFGNKDEIKALHENSIALMSKLS